jgi:hypothetical protein
MEEHLLKDLESQEDLESKFIADEREERHKDDLACIGIMLILIFIHIITQAFSI